MPLSTLYAGVVFEKQEEAEAAKAQAYWADLQNKKKEKKK